MPALTQLNITYMLTAAALVTLWQRKYEIMLRVGCHWLGTLALDTQSAVNAMYAPQVRVSQLDLNQVRRCCQCSCSDSTACNNSPAAPAGALCCHAQAVSSRRGVQTQLLFSLYIISYSCSRFRDKKKEVLRIYLWCVKVLPKDRDLQ